MAPHEHSHFVFLFLLVITNALHLPHIMTHIRFSPRLVDDYGTLVTLVPSYVRPVYVIRRVGKHHQIKLAPQVGAKWFTDSILNLFSTCCVESTNSMAFVVDEQLLIALAVAVINTTNVSEIAC